MKRLSLRNLKLPLKAAGESKMICHEILAPVFEAATEAILICGDLKPEILARMTWGGSALVREGLELTLVVMIAESPLVELKPDAIRSIWKESLQSKNTTQRLSFYKYFAQENRLNLKIRRYPDGEFHDVIKTRLQEGFGIILLTDSEGTSVDLLWRNASNKNGSSEAELEFRWSYGDPLRAVQNFHTELMAIASKDVENSIAPVEEVLLELFDLQPMPRLPWEEVFDEFAAAGRRLYNHQQDAIDAWFANGRHGIFKMCTGAGKTIAALAAVFESSAMALRAGVQPLPVIVSIPTRVLADQWCREIEAFGFPQPLKAYNAKQNWHPMLRAMLRSSNGPQPNFVVTTYSTFGSDAFLAILRQLEQDGHHCIWIADEMHNLASKRLLDQMDKLGGYCNERIGLSATPEIEGEETKTRRLRQFFEDGRTTNCGNYELAKGINDGVLCPYRYYPFPQYLQPENSERFMEILNSLAQHEASGRIDIDLYRQKREIIRSSGVQVEAFRRLVQKFLQEGARAFSHTLIYCPPGYGTSRSELDASESDDAANEQEEERLLSDVVTILREHGITVASILGETPQQERIEILRGFRRGEIQALCAVACLDEGVDVPDIRRAIVLYSVNREKQFIQRRGRILRKHPTDGGKIAEIHDVIILPQGSTLAPARSKELLKREMRRYREFAELAKNRTEADGLIENALRGILDPAHTTLQI
jgi:superfamily II DNA or RNA helicase